MRTIRPFRAASLAALALLLTVSAVGAAKPKKTDDSPKDANEDPRVETWSGLELREIGPAVTSGRVADLAVDPTDPSRWIVGAAAGGVWLTENAGTTWTPVFDGEGSFAIGAVAIAPSDRMVVWAGTGENNMQRVVAYGDGVYKSIDGGKTWTKTGLGDSGHIGRILIDPRDADVVWVAAQGPLWSSGGERGLYKTTDGGESWKLVLEISKDTGVTDIAFDPRDPDTVYAAAWQRRRHVWTMTSGGPESALYKTTDGGKSFRKLTRGLPEGDLGRIGLAVSPIDPDVVYAILEATEDGSGFYRSADRGESWEKRSGHATSGNYYVELVADPHRFDRVYSMDTFLMVTDDGGSSFRELGEWNKHVDNHAMWIDPADRDHYLVGCDGGVYESWDGAKKWRFLANLPVTQFYKVEVDDAKPFYNVYGGTQDNFSLMGPSRTRSANGILNADWEILTSGDGFQARAEPGGRVAYALAQYGSLVRIDLATREETYLPPLGEPGEAPLKWNWDSPLVLSPHSPTRLFFAAQKVYRSDDRGDSWRPVSGDLTRQIDRNTLPIFGKPPRVDMLALHGSTSPYGSVVALAESPVVEDLLYAGTDDGLVQVTEDGGGSWRKVDSVPGVGEFAYVRKLTPSRHDANVVYAAFDRHKMGDYAPYVLASPDRGRSWRSIASNLPKRGTAYVVIEDPVDPDLLFVGTEHGLYASQDRGASWFRLTGGLPTAQVRDLAIQEREGDLVVATFGRGFWILDDLSPLRFAKQRPLDAPATIFPPRPAEGYVPYRDLGYPDKGFQGDALYAAANPPFGATFTVHLEKDLESLAEVRRTKEKQLLEKGEDPPFPSHDALRAEADEEAPLNLLVVRDADGAVVRRVEAPASKGIHRVTWDLRWPAPNPARLEPYTIVNAYSYVPEGPLAAPGRYTASLEQRRLGETTTLAGPVLFEVRPLAATVLTATDRAALETFLQEASALQRVTLGASRYLGDALERVALVAKALASSPAADTTLLDEAARIRAALLELERRVDGDAAVAAHNDPVPPALVDRSSYIVSTHWSSTSAPTATARRQLELAGGELTGVLADLDRLVARDLAALEAKLDAAGAPWTPGRLPVWPPAEGSGAGR